MSNLQNVAWLYLGNSIKNISDINQLILWCSRNNVKKLLLQLSLKDLYTEDLNNNKDNNSEHNHEHHNNSNNVISRIRIIKKLIDMCVKDGIEVHGMISTLLNMAQNKYNLPLRGKEHYCVDYHGISNWEEPLGGRGFLYDPTSDDVKTLIANFCSNILKTYNKLSGIHLDFIRYFYYDSILDINTKNAGHLVLILKEGYPIKLETADGSKTTYFVEKVENSYIDPPIGKSVVLRRRCYFCFCDRCLELFQKYSNIKIPAELKTTNEKAKWILSNCQVSWDKFHADTITDLVRRIKTSISSVKSNAQLSAAIWYNSPYGNELRNEALTPSSEYKHFGQEWWKWAEDGLVDFLCPMDYWLSPENYKEIVSTQLKKVDRKIPMYFGLLRTNEYNIAAERLNEYKNVVNDLNTQKNIGLCYFHYDTWKDIT